VHPIYFFQLLTVEQIRAADATTRADYSINVFNPEEKALPKTVAEQLGRPQTGRKDAR
jgi:hypothetical protein